MSRLDGQKKSSLPLIIGLLAGFVVGVSGYTFYAQNILTDDVDNIAISTQSNQQNREYNRVVTPGDAAVKSDNESAPVAR